MSRGLEKYRKRVAELEAKVAVLPSSVRHRIPRDPVARAEGTSARTRVITIEQELRRIRRDMRQEGYLTWHEYARTP